MTGRFQVLQDIQEIPPCWFLANKSCASLTIYVIYVFFTCRYQVYVEIMAVLTHLQRNEELPAPSSGKLSTLFFFPKKKPSGFAVVSCAKQQWVAPAPPPTTNFKDFSTIVLFDCLWALITFFGWVGEDPPFKHFRLIFLEFIFEGISNERSKICWQGQVHSFPRWMLSLIIPFVSRFPPNERPDSVLSSRLFKALEQSEGSQPGS